MQSLGSFSQFVNAKVTRVGLGVHELWQTERGLSSHVGYDSNSHVRVMLSGKDKAVSFEFGSAESLGSCHALPRIQAFTISRGSERLAAPGQRTMDTLSNRIGVVVLDCSDCSGVCKQIKEIAPGSTMLNLIPHFMTAHVAVRLSSHQLFLAVDTLPTKNLVRRNTIESWPALHRFHPPPTTYPPVTIGGPR